MYDFNERISAEDAMKHDYFAEFTSKMDTNTILSKDFNSTFFDTKWSPMRHG